VPDRTALLRAGRNAATHTVKLLTNSAIRSAQFLLPALPAYRIDHLLVGPNEELQLVTLQTSVFPFQPLAFRLLVGDIGASEVVLSKGSQGVESGVAEGRVVGAKEIEV
jgi:hypothetical protein